MEYFLQTIISIFDICLMVIRSFIKKLQQKTYKSVDGEICLIVNAGRGIGRMLSIEFAKKGCNLVLWDGSSDDVEETALLVSEMGVKVYYDKVDISSKKCVEKAAEEVRKTVGIVTILVHNTGFMLSKDVFNSTEAEVQKSFGCNSLSYFWLSQAFLPDMAESDHGHVVSITTSKGLTPGPGCTAYVSSTHAVMGFHNSLRLDLKKRRLYGVKMTFVCCHKDEPALTRPSVSNHHLPALKSECCLALDDVMDAVLSDDEYITTPRLSFLERLMTLIPRETN